MCALGRAVLCSLYSLFYMGLLDGVTYATLAPGLLDGVTYAYTCPCLHFPPLQVCVDVRLPTGGVRQVLRDVCGLLAPASTLAPSTLATTPFHCCLHAVLGPSGAGKVNGASNSLQHSGTLSFPT